jgi:pimeloyl-ACP methyl ester carboxylesterase
MPPTVVYVPGLPGSHLKAPDGTRFFWNGSFSSPLLAGPDDLADDGVRAGDPILQALKFLFFDVGKKAKSLYQLLDDIGCRIVPFGWDWRRPVWEAAGGIGAVPRLAAAIRGARQQAGEPVTLICHSTGGLVARATLEAHPELARDLSRLLAFGVPGAGLVKSFREIAGRGGTPVLSAAHSQRIACRSSASFDLLPPDTATGLSMVERRGVGPTSPLVDQAWLAGLPAAERDAFLAHIDRQFAHARELLDREMRRAKRAPPPAPSHERGGVSSREPGPVLVEREALADMHRRLGELLEQSSGARK